MNQENQNVTHIQPATNPPVQSPSGGGGGGGGTDDRLAAVESRLAALEAHLQHLATKEDIQGMKVDMLKWGGSVLVAVVLAIFAAARMFFT